VSRPPWWTDADSGEAAVLSAELVSGIAAHRERCRTCQTLAHPCPVRRGIRSEEKRFDFCPLDAPPGFFAEIRRRARDHDATCEDCRLEHVGSCPTVGDAIEVVLEWRWRRGLLSRAEWLRRRHVLHYLAEIRGEAA
jgi:hypothetical protein